jgi:hypothetical protein
MAPSLKSPLRVQRGGDYLSMDNIRYIFEKFIKANAKELLRLLPDSVIFGSIILAIVTQSYSTSIFAASMLEATVFATGLRSAFSFLDIFHLGPVTPLDPSMCVSSYVTPTFETLTYLGRETMEASMPSYSSFFVATASAYVVGSMYAQKKELEALGPSFSARFYIAIFASFLLLLIQSSYRLATGCDGVGTIIMSILFGFIFGGFLIYQNISLFGRDSTNLTGVPLLRERTKEKKPLYVCPQQV